MAWFSKPRYTVLSTGSKERPQGKELWTKCESCSSVVYNKEWDDNLKVCPKCGFHQRLSGRARIALLADEGSFHEEDREVRSTDPLGFVDGKGQYGSKLVETETKTGAVEAIICGPARMEGIPVELAVMDFSFLGGSMGSVVGEKICRAVDRAIRHKRALIIVSCSGGARMHEGILSLMQMAKTCAALGRLGQAGIPFISVLTHPTTGGVTASYASVGDVVIAEPGALIGFAGPRVIEQTIRQKLPEGFQTAEFLVDHGFVDLIVERKDMKAKIVRILQFLQH